MDLEFTLHSIQEAAGKFWNAVGDHKVFAFHGTMGAGKTTFISALCMAKGVKDVVGSPTFSIINEYIYDCSGTKRPVFHMDLYRVNSEEEAQRAGIEDALYSGNLCLVEWPEKAPGIFPDDTVNVYIELTGTETRRLKIANI